MRSTFNRIVLTACDTGRLARLQDNLTDTALSTLYLPNTPPVIVRDRGSRSLSEIPRSEILALAEQIEQRDGPDTNRKRAVLDELGFVRLTDRAQAYLEECFGYTWHV